MPDVGHVTEHKFSRDFVGPGYRGRVFFCMLSSDPS